MLLGQRDEVKRGKARVRRRKEASWYPSDLLRFTLIIMYKHTISALVCSSPGSMSCCFIVKTDVGIYSYRVPIPSLAHAPGR